MTAWEELDNRHAIVNKTAGKTFWSLKKYEKTAGTMLKYIIVNYNK